MKHDQPYHSALTRLPRHVGLHPAKLSVQGQPIPYVAFIKCLLQKLEQELTYYGNGIRTRATLALEHPSVMLPP